MYTCDESADRLLDYLYGLLEADEIQSLRDHLATCPACQAALAEAEAQQHLLARAAHVALEVPAFVAPSDRQVEVSPAPRTPEAPAASPATSALPAPKSRTLPRWPWLATAAALLLLAGGLYAVHESGRHQRQTALAQARQEVAAVDARFAQASRTYQQDLARLPAKLQTRQLRVAVTGPASYQIDAPSQVRVVTQDANGAPAAAQLQVAFVDATGKRTVFLQEFQSSGATVVPLPAGLEVKPGEGAQLIVKGRTDRGEAELRENLATAGPTYLTHVVLSKPLYRPGEVVFFRTLTLDRFSLKPPGREFAVTYTLRDAQNGLVKKLAGKTRPDGIGGGEFALANNLAGGEYTLEVAPATTSAGERLLPQTHHFTVVRAQPTTFAGAGGMTAPQFQFDRSAYVPGDKVKVEFYSQYGAKGAAAANQAVTVKAREGNGQPIRVGGAPAGQPYQTSTDARGRAAFELQLNRNGAAGKPVVEVEVANGKANARYEKAIPVVAPYPAVEFFPEGGDLVAGVPNRVYVRAQTPQGAPANLDARLVDQQGTEVVHVQTLRGAGPATQRGVGSFTFTPQTGETYKLQLAAPGTGPAALPLPAVYATGVALSVPEAVGREGEPIRAVVRHTGTEGRLLVLATCRGHVVDQQFITATRAGTDVRLTPVPGTRGVVRLTVYEVRQDRLIPRAERLAYQLPSERLELAVVNAGKDGAITYQGGAQAQLTFKARSEKGEPTSAVFLAAAVAEQGLPPAAQPEQGPPAFFYLTSQVRGGEDLENADFLVSDAPQARAALDLFLGTEGWRRFAEPTSGTMVAQPGAGQPAVFSRNNFDQVTARYEADLASGRNALRQQALQEREALQEERSERTVAVTSAAAALRDYEELPRRVFRSAVGVLVLLLLAVGGLCLIGGFLRAVRGRRPTVAFATAFTSLLLCLVIYGASGDLRQEDHASVDPGLRAQLSDRELPRLPETAPPREPQRPETTAGRAPVGRFAEAGEHKQAGALAARPFEGASSGPEARSLQKDQGMVRRRAVEELRGAAKETAANKNEQSTAKAKGDKLGPNIGKSSTGARGPAPIAPVAAPATPPGAAPQAAMAKKHDARPGTAEAKDAAQERLSLRQFAYRADRPVRDFPDTVLWYPALAAPDGTAHVSFDLPAGTASYRVLLYAHSPSGRLGSLQGKIETRK